MQLVSYPNVVSANSAHLAPEANSPSIPNYQWQFLSEEERAALDASLRVMVHERFKNITLNIHEDAGVPYTGKLSVTQTSTEFINWAGWGPSVVGLPDHGLKEYLAMTPSRSHSLYAPWNEVEPVRGKWDFS